MVADLDQIPETKPTALSPLRAPSQRSLSRLKSNRYKSKQSQEDRRQWHRE
jgi:hypothetical protein